MEYFWRIYNNNNKVDFYNTVSQPTRVMIIINNNNLLMYIYICVLTRKAFFFFYCNIHILIASGISWEFLCVCAVALVESNAHPMGVQLVSSQKSNKTSSPMDLVELAKEVQKVSLLCYSFPSGSGIICWFILSFYFQFSSVEDGI